MQIIDPAGNTDVGHKICNLKPSLALSHDGKLLAASGIPHGDKKDCSVELWDVTNGNLGDPATLEVYDISH